MKKMLCLLAVIAIVSTKVNAQTEKGNIMLGGSVQYISSEGSSVFLANPNLGFFVANNIAVGGDLSLLTSDGSTVWGVGPYVRGYLGKNMSGKPFAQVGVQFAGTEGESATAFAGKLGYAVFLNKSIALEFAGNVLAQSGATTFGLGAGFQIHFKK